MPDYTSSTNTEAIKFEAEGYDESVYNNSENTTEKEFEVVGESLTPSNRPFDPYAQTGLTGDQFNQIVFGNDNRVFGMPFNYTPLADPLQRVYEYTFESDNNTVYITFGTTRLNRSLANKLNIGGKLADALLNIGKEIVTSTAGTDPRFISFRPNFKEFYKYASTAANYLWSMMDLPGAFDWDDNFESTFNQGGCMFYCTKNTSVTEGVSNEYTEHELVSSANQNALEYRMSQQANGVYGNVDGGLNFGETIKTKVTEFAEEMLCNMPIIGNISSSFFQANKGSMMYYGKIWSNSNSNNSYSLHFKFMSPYGSKVDIFRNVYFPFLLLYTAASARQDGKYAYKEPFLVNVQFPG